MEVGDLPSWIALVLSILALSWQGYTERRNRTKEATALKLDRLRQVEASLHEIRATAMGYWLQPENLSARDGLMLVQHLRELSRHVSSYKELLWESAQKDVISLKILLTGGSFQQVDRPVYPPSDAFVQRFMGVISDVLVRVEDIRDSIEG